MSSSTKTTSGKTQQPKNTGRPARGQHSSTVSGPMLEPIPALADAVTHPAAASPRSMRSLQRQYGNQAVLRLIQTDLTARPASRRAPVSSGRNARAMLQRAGGTATVGYIQRNKDKETTGTPISASRLKSAARKHFNLFRGLLYQGFIDEVRQNLQFWASTSIDHDILTQETDLNVQVVRDASAVSTTTDSNTGASEESSSEEAGPQIDPTIRLIHVNNNHFDLLHAGKRISVTGDGGCYYHAVAIGRIIRENPEQYATMSAEQIEKLFSGPKAEKQLQRKQERRERDMRNTVATHLQSLLDENSFDDILMTEVKETILWIIERSWVVNETLPFAVFTAGLRTESPLANAINALVHEAKVKERLTSTQPVQSDQPLKNLSSGGPTPLKTQPKPPPSPGPASTGGDHRSTERARLPAEKMYDDLKSALATEHRAKEQKRHLRQKLKVDKLREYEEAAPIHEAAAAISHEKLAEKYNILGARLRRAKQQKNTSEIKRLQRQRRKLKRDMKKYAAFIRRIESTQRKIEKIRTSLKKATKERKQAQKALKGELKKQIKQTKKTIKQLPARIEETERELARVRYDIQEIEETSDSELVSDLVRMVDAEMMQSLTERERQLTGQLTQLRGQLSEEVAKLSLYKDIKKGQYEAYSVYKQIRSTEARYETLLKLVDPILTGETGKISLELRVGVSTGYGADGVPATAKIGANVVVSGEIWVADDRKFRMKAGIGVKAYGKADLVKALQAEGSVGADAATVRVFDDAQHWAAWMSNKISAKVAKIRIGRKKVLHESPTAKDFKKLKDLGLPPDAGHQQIIKKYEDLRKTGALPEQPTTDDLARIGFSDSMIERLLKYAKKKPLKVYTGKLSGSAKVGAFGLAGVSGSGSGERMKFVKQDESGKRHKAVGKQIVFSAGAKVGPLKFDFTWTRVRGHSNPDNDGDYKNYKISTSPVLFKFAMENAGASPNEEPADWFEDLAEKFEESLLGDDPSNVDPETGNQEYPDWFEDLKEQLSDTLAELKITTDLPFDSLNIATSGSMGYEWNKIKTGRENKYHLQYRRFTSSKSLGGDISIPTSQPVNVDIGASGSIEKAWGETLGTTTLTYLQTVYNGLITVDMRDVGIKPGEDEAINLLNQFSEGRWYSYVKTHEKRVKQILRNVGKGGTVPGQEVGAVELDKPENREDATEKALLQKAKAAAAKFRRHCTLTVGSTGTKPIRGTAYQTALDLMTEFFRATTALAKHRVHWKEQKPGLLTKAGQTIVGYGGKAAGAIKKKLTPRKKSELGHLRVNVAPKAPDTQTGATIDMVPDKTAAVNVYVMKLHTSKQLQDFEAFDLSFNVDNTVRGGRGQNFIDLMMRKYGGLKPAKFRRRFPERISWIASPLRLYYRAVKDGNTDTLSFEKALKRTYDELQTSEQAFKFPRPA